MRWPFRRHERVEEDCPDLPDCEGLERAHQALQESLDRWPEVREQTSRMRQLRHANHFSEKLEQPWREHRR